MTEVFEDPEVGVLMDVNQRLTAIKSMTEDVTGVKYGSDWNDIRRDMQGDNAAHAAAILSKHPDVWYDVLRANLMVAGSATDRKTLESVALQVAAIATAWATDLRSRNN